MSKGNKKPMKEKVVQLYEALIKSDDLSLKDENFWNEFFLLKANITALESVLNETKDEDFLLLKPRVNAMIAQCINSIKGENQIRAVNALITLCAITKCVANRSRKNPSKFDFIDFIIGRERMELKCNFLIELFCTLLVNDIPIAMKSLVLQLFLNLVSAFDDVNKNPIMEHLMSDQLFDALFHLLNDSHHRQHLGYKVILLITIHVNYRKYESANPYIMKLSIVDDEVALSGYAQVLSNTLLAFNKPFDQTNSEPKSAGLFSSLTSMVGNMFIAEEDHVETNNFTSNNAVLLAFFEAVHLNRNFITLLTNSPTESYPIGRETHSDINNLIDEDAIQNPPSNLLVAFLEFSSIIMLHTKEEENLQTSRLCFIILTCISEDQCANAIMHDVNMAFRVNLHQMPMRHRKMLSRNETKSRPLSYSVLDLMLEFILTHMRKSFLLELYQLCVGVIHRLLCYQKKCKIRVEYSWKDLWSALISLFKFIINNEAELIKKCNIFLLALQVVNIFNLFITFGDTFLPSPQAYDQLYYEIIRMHSIFEQLHSMALRHVSNEGARYKETASKLNNSLVNIKAIINHFNAKIDSWSAVNQTMSLTEDQVLTIVKNNYDTLTLKLQDNLDQYEVYNYESSLESNFFAKLLMNVIIESRTQIILNAQEHQTLIQHLQMLSNVSIFNSEIVSV